MQRRHMVLAGLAALATPGVAHGAPFGRATVETMAAALAASPFAMPDATLPSAFQGLDYDSYRQLQFRDTAALWADLGLGHRLHPFPRGYLFPHRVALHEVVNGEVRPWRFDAADFTAPWPLPAGDPGFAGFKLLGALNAPSQMDEIVSFLGASYFRAIGRGHAYGVSARGIALGTGTPAEEFPAFRAFWVERPTAGATSLVVHALLDGPSVAGAYRFQVTPGPTTRMQTAVTLYPRVPLTSLGLAPASSMFRQGAALPGADPRPAVHDSDGLLLEDAGGGRIWRALANPTAPRTTWLAANRARGFGLLQRSRRFADFQDAEALYHQRPSLWVVPEGDWGDGRLGLLELPTDSEYHDNIAAFWQPAQPVPPGTPFRAGWTLHWADDAPLALGLARIASTRRDGARFTIRYEGTAISEPDIVLMAEAGRFQDVALRPVPEGAELTFRFEAAGAAELRVCLQRAGRPVAEEWRLAWPA